MNKMIIAAALTTALGLTGCATTPSKPLTFEQLGQYSATPLNAQSYRISFQARPNMRYGTAEEITLVKAAQTTLQNGFQYFKVMDDPSNRSQKPPRQAVIYPDPMPYPYGYYRRHPGFWPTPFYDVPQVVTLDPTQVSYSITCYKDRAKAPQDAFDARLILQSLGAKYGLDSQGHPLPVTTTPTQK